MTGFDVERVYTPPPVIATTTSEVVRVCHPRADGVRTRTHALPLDVETPSTHTDRMSNCPRTTSAPHDCAVSSCHVWEGVSGYIPAVHPHGPQTLDEWTWSTAAAAADAQGWSLYRAERAAAGRG